jgi:L-alanine-DL-glutamate epimerase-like enolase superfamily enzyme
MSWTIVNAEPRMIALKLREPFRFAYGIFYELPRVLVKLDIESSDDAVVGWGEAAIDFPFVPYDAFDTFDALNKVCSQLPGVALSDRDEILFSTFSTTLDLAPASRCALNMALDDALGRARKLPVESLYGVKRTHSLALHSVGFGKSDCSSTWRALNGIIKIKMGQGLLEDVRTIRRAEELSLETAKQYALDFNAAYTTQQALELIRRLEKEGCWPSRSCVMWEQPVQPDTPLEEWALLAENFNPTQGGPLLAADESFTSDRAGINLSTLGVGLNFKIQRLGGLLSALRIESVVQRSRDNLTSFIGGTFPSPLGRAYDKIAVHVLASAHIPGDGYLSASTYLNESVLGAFVESSGHNGLGITPDEDTLTGLTINDPVEEFTRIRSGKTPLQIKMDVGPSYAAKYKSLTKRDVFWNLQRLPRSDERINPNN